MTSKANAYEVWVLAPLTAVAVAYNITQLIPCIWLPQNWNQLGYPSDLFLLLHQRTTVTTQVLREALTPEGSLSALAQTWLERFGGESIDRLLWRLSSVDGRKLYLVLGAWPILACSYCSHKLDCQLYAAFALLAPYLATAMLVGLLTIPPRGALPRMVQWLVGESTEPTTITPQYTRESLRFPATLALLIAFAAEVFVIVRAEELGSVYGRWEHWHANIHLLRHTFFLVLIGAVYFCRKLRRPATEVIGALRSLSVTSANVDALVDRIKTKDN